MPLSPGLGLGSAKGLDGMMGGQGLPTEAKETSIETQHLANANPQSR